MHQQVATGDSNGSSSSSYLSVVETCNTLIHSLGKNLWSKYFPEENTNGGNVNLQFDIEPGDSTPRRVMVCLAKQVHNFKCVAKILERVKEAEKMLQSLDADEDDEEQESARKEVNLTLLGGINSQLTVLAKCEAAMRRRHSVRHRVVPVDRAACVALCDIDCPLLSIQLSQQESYTLLDNSNRQSWLVEEPLSGRRQRVPPLFLAAEPETGELARIGRVQAGLGRAARAMVAALAAGQLGAAARQLRSCQDDVGELLGSTEASKSFQYRLQRLEKYLRMLTDASAQMSLADARALLETVNFLMEKIQLVTASKPTPVTAQLLKMQNGLGVLRAFAHTQEVTGRLLSRDAHGGSRRSFRSGRSHPLTSPNRRTSVLEFEFEFQESTHTSSTVSRRRRAASTSDLSQSTTRFTSETVIRQRQEVARKFVIQSVWDGRKEVSLQDAVAAGVVNFQRGVYVELLGSRAEMPLEAAMAAGKIRVELVTSEQLSEDNSSFGLISVEESRQTDDGQAASTSSASFVVHAVVDVAGKRRLNFQEAAQLGLIDRETGAFRNSATGEVLAPGDAINRGFFKAYPVEDPRSLDIEPENRITVKHFNKLKSRWSAVNAFAKARGGGKDT